MSIELPALGAEGEMQSGSKGRRWEIVNSLWIIWALIPTFAWVAFIWIGAKGKDRRWMLWGALYFVAFLAIWIGIAAHDGKKDDGWTSLLGLALIAHWLAGIAHSFFVRRDYLIRLQALEPFKASEQQAQVAAIVADRTDPNPRPRVQALLDSCDTIVVEIEGQLSLEVKSQPGALRSRYADALTLRSQGEQLLQNARSAQQVREAEAPLKGALAALQQVAGELSTPAG